MKAKREEVPLQQIINALLDETTPFPALYLHRFSDLESANLKAMRDAWPRVNPSRRMAILADLEELAETDTLVDFDQFARVALDDSEAGVRSRAIHLLWEDEEVDLVPRFLTMLENDSSAEVRAAAASALGKYIYLGEIEEMPETLLHTIEDALLKAHASADDALVRRRALEAMGFSSRVEVGGLIQSAYDSKQPDWVASALFAMGRSYNKTWESAVNRMLHHPKSNVQLEAVRAAGELELDSAREHLLALLDEEAQDTEIRFAAIWSLSQIGGDEVRDTLEEILEESEDEEEIEWVDNALDNLNLTETGLSMDLMDINMDDEEMYDSLIDLSDADVDDADRDSDENESLDIRK